MADAASVRSASAALSTTTARHTAVVRATHWISTLCFFALLLSGVEIVISHPRFYWGEEGNVLTPLLFTLPIPASRSSVVTGYEFVLPDQNGWSRYLHFQAAWIAVLTGLLYIASSLFKRHFRNHLLPARSDLTWGTISRVFVNHLRFRRPSEAEAWSYNVLQRLAYLFVVFVLFPLMIWTGLAMSPAIASAFPLTVTVLGGQQSARTIHFFGSLSLVLFLLVHILMVRRAGFGNRTRTMITGRVDTQRGGVASSNFSRRKVITQGLAAAAGLSGLVEAARVADRHGLIPPDHGGIYGFGETLTYASQRLLTRHALAREFPRNRISKTPFANGKLPEGEEFERLRAGGFADWRLVVDGMVARPASFSLAELRTYPSGSQITHLACEEGWSFIAEWIGVPLFHILNAVRILPHAAYVVYFSIQRDWWDSIDMADAFHPQTFVTYGMNGGELSVAHGGPLRLRVPRQLGYKSVKYINRLTITDSLKKFSPEGSYAWYAGI